MMIFFYMFTFRAFTAGTKASLKSILNLFLIMVQVFSQDLAPNMGYLKYKFFITTKY